MLGKIIKWLVVPLAGLFFLWIAGAYFTVAGIEQPHYDVVGKRDGYELRRYGPMLMAETDMPTLVGMDRGRGFQVLAGYIFGGNTSRESIAMTAPVVMGAVKPAGTAEKIAMTAPVVMSAGDGTPGTMRFVMPSRFKSLAELPRPNDTRVRLVEVPARTVAVSSFSWFATGPRVVEQSAALANALARDKVTTASPPSLASYNPPFTPPFMQRHEIMVEVK